MSKLNRAFPDAVEQVQDILEDHARRLRDEETSGWSQPASSPLVTLTTNTTLDETYRVILVDASGGAVTLTLPLAALSLGYVYTVKKIDASANAMVLDGNGGELIDGLLTQSTTTQYDVLRVVCDGTAWWLI